jgi:glycosyltransferase involved in cell wall biosynthesis
MRILFLTSTLPRFPSDQQAPFVLQQAAAWKARRPQDEVHILAPHDSTSKKYELIGDIEIHRFQYFFPESYQSLAYPAILPNLKKNPLLSLQIPFFLWSEFQAAKSLTRKHGINLVYAHWVMPQGLTARWLSRATGVPYVVQNHSSDLSVFARFGKVGKSVARKIIRDAKAMFCVNSLQREYGLALFAGPEKAEIAEKISVLPMGVEPDLASFPSRPNRITRYRLGSISRLSRKKGIDLLIAAIQRLNEPITVAVAGDGEEMDSLKAMSTGSSIDFPGFLTGADKLRFLEETDIMVFPSISVDGDVEGLPVALLEALFCGKVVIASRDTNIAMLPEWEAIKNDVFLLDDPRNLDSFARTIKRALQLTPDEIMSRSKSLRSAMSRYHWNKLMDEYLTALGLSGQSLT